MTVTEIKKLLRELEVRPSRKLGQNFLCDAEAAAWIVKQLGSVENDCVIEVGAGTGALTAHLAGAKARRVVAIEKDARLAAYLARRFAGPGVEIIEGDALDTDLRPYFAQRPLSLVGNLPYSSGGEIIRHFLGHGSPVGRAVIMVQKEVAARLCAGPGTKDFGALSLRVQSVRKVRVLRDFEPSCFHPEPQVESSVVLLETRAPGSLVPFDRRRFEGLVQRGFSQRRKKLKNLLGETAGRWGDLAGALGVPETARAEQLSLEQWIALTNMLDPSPPPQADETGGEIFDVVDEENRVTGRATRREVHEAGWRHRAAHIFVFNARGELFLQKRSHLKDRHPGVWDSSAAGHLDAGEDYEAAARRELREELGMEIETGAFEEVARLDACEATGWEFIRLYAVAAEGKPRWAPSEIECGAFFPMAVVAAWIEARPEDFAPGFIECWKRRETGAV